jgi:hypothetical protein
MLWLQDLDIVMTTNHVPEELKLNFKTIPNQLVQNKYFGGLYHPFPEYFN